MNACTWASCGDCGRCDDGLRNEPEPRTHEFCDECGRDAFQPYYLGGAGVFCSESCKSAGLAKFEARSARRTA